ncbi:MAG: YceI family protein [Saprospiraceae bacterium]
MTRSIFFSSISWAIAAITLFSNCSNTPQGDQAKVAGQEQAANATGQAYRIDTAASIIHFVGNGVGKNHPGTFHLASGSLSVADNQLTGGQLVINIQSLDLEQRDEMIQQKLRPHLLSPDFFDVEKFGTATFVLTKVEPFQAAASDTSIVQGANFKVSGNLTLKGVTKNITFPAKVDLEGTSLHAQSNFNLERTAWGMNFHADKSLGDKFISETVNVRLDLRAKQE